MKFGTHAHFRRQYDMISKIFTTFLLEMIVWLVEMKSEKIFLSRSEIQCILSDDN